VILFKTLVSLLGLAVFWGCSAPSSDDGEPGHPGAGTGNGAGGSSSSAGGSGFPASGAGNQLAIDAGDGTDAGEVKNGTCATQDFALSSKPAQILLLLDRSGSMLDPPDGSSGSSKWDLVVPGVNEVIMATDASVSWGLKLFPEGEGAECIAASVTNAVPAPIAPMNAKVVTGLVAAASANGNGTPTGDAMKAAVSYLKTVTDPNPKYILLATDGEPSCAGTTKGSSAARPHAVQAVADAAAAGFKTFVVGVATKKASATEALNDMAIAGQMARADSDPLATKYYLASTRDELVQSLKVITGQASSCVFNLTERPPEPNNIAVKINGTRVPRDTTRMTGWDYTDTSDLVVEVFGSWCEQIKISSENTVNFVIGCAGAPPPQ
jgi:hypothetical protein